jgi:hypothetical protein
MAFGVVYPDVLGGITGGGRIVIEDLQYAVGISPTQAFINQLLEIVVPLQSMIDQPLQVKVSVRLPSRDKKGNPVFMEAGKTTMTIGLRPGEVGVLRIPIIAHPPTPAGKGYRVQVSVRYRSPGNSIKVRPPDGGPPPSVLTISPFRMQVLQDIAFITKRPPKTTDAITATFDLAPKRLPRPDADSLKPKYDSLWATDQIQEEEELARARIGEARRIALGLGHPTSYWELLDEVKERFAERDMPLHPGEVTAIAKIMSYTVDEAPELEKQMSVESTHWFRTLCQVLAHDESIHDLPRGELLAKYVFDAILFDAIEMGFHVLQPKVKDKLGSSQERLNYANRLLTWFAGYGEPDLSYVYLPLVLAGLVVYRLVTLNVRENPWILIDDLTEAMQGRKRLEGNEESTIIFKMLDDLLEEQTRNVRSQRIERPT